MVKYILLIALSFQILTADIFSDKVRSLVGEKNFRLHANLIKIIFKNKQNFIKNGQINTIKVSKVLKENGLLKLFFNKPQDISVMFKTNQNPLFFMKLINDSLKSLGYYFFITKSAEKQNNIFQWEININTEYAIDPVIFAKELKKRGCIVTDLDRKSDIKWVYNIDMINSNILEAKYISDNEEIKLAKPIDDYWLRINSNAKKIKLSTHRLDNWFPYLAFYDKDLHVIEIFKKDERTREITINIPDGCKYITISDIYILNNIKRGLKVLVKGKN